MNVVRGGSPMRFEDVALIAMCVCAIAGIVLLTVMMTRSNNEFDRACREAGGVVIRSYGARNCATSGYIDVR